jgi:ABC-type uncharacterized transport system permease subunit
MEANQTTENINEKKKKTLATEKPIICEIVFCGLGTRSVNVIIEMPIADSSIHYRAVIDRN